jgi:hypothetical protein
VPLTSDAEGVNDAPAARAPEPRPAEASARVVEAAAAPLAGAGRGGRPLERISSTPTVDARRSGGAGAGAGAGVGAGAGGACLMPRVEPASDARGGGPRSCTPLATSPGDAASSSSGTKEMRALRGRLDGGAAAASPATDAAAGEATLRDDDPPKRPAFTGASAA